MLKYEQPKLDVVSDKCDSTAGNNNCSNCNGINP
jgi:hypothetical protein